MAELKLDVHDITVSETTTFSRTGTALPGKHVSFFVGEHGPFTLDYRPEDATPARIKADIKKQQADLLSIHELGV